MVSPEKLTSAAKKIESFTFHNPKQYEVGFQTLTDFTAKLLKHYVAHSEDIEIRKLELWSSKFQRNSPFEHWSFGGVHQMASQSSVQKAIQIYPLSSISLYGFG